MTKRLIILLIVISLVLTSCGDVNTGHNVESNKNQSEFTEVTELDESKINKYLKRWNCEFTAIYGNFSYQSDLIKVALENEAIEVIVHEEFDGLEFGSDEYINFLTNWSKENLSHTREQDEYRNLRSKEPWLGTFKILIPHEMMTLGSKKDLYIGHCTSLANFTISLLRKSGLSKNDYILLNTPNHTIAIFKYNQEFYAISNNKIVLITDDIKEKDWPYIGYYHEDSSIISKFTLSKDFYEYDDSISLTQRIVELTDIDESEIYTSNLDPIHEKYLERRIDVPDFNLYIKASIEEPNVQILSREFTEVADVLNWVETNIELISNDDRVQLADETIVYGQGTALNRAVLIKSIFNLMDMDCRIYYNDKETYIEIDGEYYSATHFEEV